MQIIEIETLSNGAHRNQSEASICPDGWAKLPDDMKTPNFPFGSIETEMLDGIMTVTKWTATETPKPTVEDIRAAAQSRIDGCCSAAIASGVTVNKLHYTLTALAQHDLSVMAAQAKEGTTSFLYHADGEGMRVYTADEITAIAAAATEWVTVNTAYYDLLKSWVTRETDVDKLGTIKYGSKLPDDLMQQLTGLCKSVGIDVSKYAALFTA